MVVFPGTLQVIVVVFFFHFLFHFACFDAIVYVHFLLIIFTFGLQFHENLILFTDQTQTSEQLNLKRLPWKCICFVCMGFENGLTMCHMYGF